MFMGKIEINNTIKLTKVKFRIFKKNLIRALLITVLLLLVNLLPSLSLVFQEIEQVRPISLQNFSFVLFFAGVIVSLFMNVSYRTTNDLYSVYPQNNTSRFLSSQLINYSYILFLAIASLVIYFIQYAIFGILSMKYGNIFLAYRFNIKYLISGFFVFVVYLSLIAVFITLVAVLLRKYTVYAFVVFSMILSVTMYNDLIKEHFVRILGIIIYESSLSLFFVKSILLWFILMFVAFKINKGTDYYRSESAFSKAVVVGIIAVIVLGLTIVPQIAVTNYSSSNVRISRHEEVLVHEEDIETIDLSHLPSGSTINVIFRDSKNMNVENMYLLEDTHERTKGSVLVLKTRFPIYITDGIDITRYIEPNIVARLEENRLYLDYSFNENIKVVILSPWQFMFQFDRFRDKGIFKEMTGSSSSRGSGYIRIQSPEDMNIKLSNN